MDLSGKMDRTLAINRIPASRICRAVKLGIKTDLPHGILGGMANQPSCRLPCRPAGCPTNDMYLSNLPILYGNRKFRSPEMLTIVTKADLPWKTTSGGRGDQAFAAYLFPRGNNRDILLRTKCGEIRRQIVVT